MLPVLADHVPPGSRLALAGRTEPPLRIPRLRAEGKITEIGTGDLSLTLEEASSLRITPLPDPAGQRNVDQTSTYH